LGDNAHFVTLNNLCTQPIQLTPEIKQLLGIFEQIGACVSTLVENKEYSFGKQIAKRLCRRIETILEEGCSKGA
jgi:hypothetical protein